MCASTTLVFRRGFRGISRQERESALSTQVEAGRVERGVKGGKQEMMEDELMILKRTGGAQSTETGERGEDGLKRAAHPMRKLLGSWSCVLWERCEPHPKKVLQSSKEEIMTGNEKLGCDGQQPRWRGFVVARRRSCGPPGPVGLRVLCSCCEVLVSPVLHGSVSVCTQTTLATQGARRLERGKPNFMQ